MSFTWAGIGSRRLSQKEFRFCQALGAYLQLKGAQLRTGAALGADQAFAEGVLLAAAAKQIQPRVTLCLPWGSYEKEWVKKAKGQGALVEVLKDDNKEAFKSVDVFHPAAARLTRGPRALHARNYLIVRHVNVVIAFPKPTNRGGLGGTGQGIRIAEHFNIPVIRLDTKEGVQQALQLAGIDQGE